MLVIASGQERTPRFDSAICQRFDKVQTDFNLVCLPNTSHLSSIKLNVARLTLEYLVRHMRGAESVPGFKTMFDPSASP